MLAATAVAGAIVYNQDTLLPLSPAECYQGFSDK